mgnify:CR=1 FL=1
MNKPVLVVMAAGMGSRYGGMKQIDPVGPNGQGLMDYSLYDARRAGFETVIFVIKHEIEDAFKAAIGDRVAKVMNVKYAFQQLDELPAGFSIPEGRVKPWGTCHAVLAAKDLIDGPFAVINADDYYGPEAFQVMYDYLSTHADDEFYRYCMVSYLLKNTLSENGSVARGVCIKNEDGTLQSVTERTRIEPCDGGAHYTEDGGESWVDLPGDTPVSMNLWGFGKSFLDEAEQRFAGWLTENLPKNPLKCEYFLPLVVTELIEEGKAKIDYDKCVSCGMCLVNCPFGAIVDKGQIFQLITAMKKKKKVIAIVAPAFVGQFGPKASPEKLTAAMKKLGFADVVEVAIGADLCSIEEAKDFMREVPEHQPFMATSCCPAWSVMAKKLFPTLAPYISMALTPMVLTARMLKKDDPDACIAFIGPCAAKKLEASRRTIRSDVDFVLTFEELMGMFNAKGVTFEDITDEEKVDLCEGTGDGRGFAVSGGVAKAVADVIHKLDPEREVKVVSAQGLKDCRKLLTLAKAGKYDGYLLEGMACPGGCVAGAGTLQAVEKSTALVNKYVKDAPLQNSLDSKYEINLDLITEPHDDK